MLSVVVAASCRDHTGIEEDFPIGLSALSSFTRSVIQDINDFNTQGSFGVYGYKSVGSYRQIFIDQKVNYNSTSTAWEYIPIKYWDRNCYYNFGAYAPYFDDTSSDTDPYLSHNSVSSGSDDHVLTVNNVPNWQWAAVRYYNTGSDEFTTSDNDDCVDLQYAYSQDEAQNYITNSSGYVHFTFNHVLAWLEIQVACPSLTPVTDYFITGLSIGNDPAFSPTHDNCNVPDGTGKFAYSLNYTADPATGSCGTPGGTPGYATLYPASTGQILKLTADYQVLCSSLCVPFSVTGDGIFLNLSYNTGSAPDTKKSVAIPLSNTENLKVLEGGKKYVVKLSFEMGEPLKVVKVYITNWASGVTSEHQFYNW